MSIVYPASHYWHFKPTFAESGAQVTAGDTMMVQACPVLTVNMCIPVNDRHAYVTDDVVCKVPSQQLCTKQTVSHAMSVTLN